MAENEQVVRVCVVTSTLESALNEIDGPPLTRDDILLTYDVERKSITRVDGYASSVVKVGPNLAKPVIQSELEDTPGFSLQYPLPGSDSFSWLRADQWTSIRRAIVSQNPELEDIIDRLEAAQWRQPSALAGASAVLFDAFCLAIEAFGPENRDDLLGQLDEVRSSFLADMRTMSNQVPTNYSFSQMLLDKVRTSTFGESVGVLNDPVHLEFAKLISTADEIDAVNKDFDVGPNGWTRIPINSQMNMAKLLDPKTDRELLLIRAHKQGAGKHDLAGADLIYDTVSHHSVVLVQYKKLSEAGTIRRSDIDRQQLNVLLNFCQLGKCSNMNADARALLSHTEIRLRDCPAYYKLLDHEPVVPTGKRHVPGRFLQACLLETSLDTPAKCDDAIRRGMVSNVFHDLLGSTQIGSSAESYDVMRQKLVSFMRHKSVYASESRLAPAGRR